MLNLAASILSLCSLLAPPSPPPHAPPEARLVAPAVPLSSYRLVTIEGFPVLLHPTFREDDRRDMRVLAALRFDLWLIAQRIPAPALDRLRTVRVVVTPETAARIGLTGRGMCYHASAEWLASNGFDREREGTVEILNADDFLTWRAEQPMMTLHELAHAYHHMLGVDRPDIRAALDRAVASGVYDAVAHALATPDKPRRAYALTNPTEYFAEVTEALFGLNDFAPRTREELERADPEGA